MSDADARSDDLLLLTPEEAARRLSVGRTTIYALMRRGELGSVAVGRSRRIPTRSLQQYVDRLVEHSTQEDELLFVNQRWTRLQ
jgi:excisionase family DNA binding protein